jgi:hypothetical protein
MSKYINRKILKKLVQNNKKTNDYTKSFNNNRTFLGIKGKNRLIRPENVKVELFNLLTCTPPNHG